MRNTSTGRRVWRRSLPVLAIIATASLGLLAALGGLAYSESATVKILVPVQRLTANATISGGQAGQELATHLIDASVTESQVGTASPVAVGATTATGEVLFRYRCEWVGYLNQRRLDSADRDVPTTEYEALYDRQRDTTDVA